MRLAATTILMAQALASPAFAASILGAPIEPPQVNERIVQAVTRNLGEPADLWIRALRKSLARSGQGYCGEAALGKDGPFLAFHVLIEPDGKDSALLLSDDQKAGGLLSPADTARLLKNFGCLE